jgi:hypothetical protein
MVFFTKHSVVQAPVAHDYNSSYSGVKDQENCGLNPAQGNSWPDPRLKKLFTQKKSILVAQYVGPDFKP